MIFVLLAVVTLICLNSTKGKGAAKVALFLSVLYILIFTFRDLDVDDTEAYLGMYNGDGTEFIEKGYIWLNEFVKDLGASFTQFLFMIALFNMTVWYVCTRKLFGATKMLLPLLVFMSFAGVYNYGIILRASITDTLMYTVVTMMLLNIDRFEGVRRGTPKGPIIMTLIVIAVLALSFTIHQTSLVLILVLLLYLVPLNNLTRYSLVCFSLMLFVIPGLATLLTKPISLIITYNELRGGNHFDEDGTMQLGLTNVFLAMTSTFYIYNIKYIKSSVERRKYELVLDIFIAGVVITALFSYIRAGARLGILLMFFEFLIPSFLMRNIDRNHYKRVMIVIVVIVMVNMLKLLTNVLSLWHYL